MNCAIRLHNVNSKVTHIKVEAITYGPGFTRVDLYSLLNLRALTFSTESTLGEGSIGREVDG